MLYTISTVFSNKSTYLIHLSYRNCFPGVRRSAVNSSVRIRRNLSSNPSLHISGDISLRIISLVEFSQPNNWLESGTAHTEGRKTAAFNITATSNHIFVEAYICLTSREPQHSQWWNSKGNTFWYVQFLYSINLWLLNQKFVFCGQKWAVK